MNIAIVLYGQPREYKNGYNAIMNLINNNKDCNFDFFYHCWILEKNDDLYEHTLGTLPPSALIYNEKVITDLKELYKPKSYLYEKEKNVNINCLNCENSLLGNSPHTIKSRIKNNLCNMYSKNKSRDVLNSYLNETNNATYYDFVLMTRFDITIIAEVIFNKLEKSKTYVSDMHLPRKIMSDACIIAPTDVFLKWFNIYNVLPDIINNKELILEMRKINETLYINPEEIITAAYLFHYKNLDNIRYFKGGILHR